LVRQQRTLKAEAVYEGVGIHTGETARLRFIPAEPNAGIRFRVRQDGEWVEIPAHVDSAPQDAPFERSTKLIVDGASVTTVEHVLATLYGLSVDNCVLELDGPEPPEPADGSCKSFVDAILAQGIIEQGVPATEYEVTRPVQWSREGTGITAIPYDGFRVSFTIQYDNSVIGTQYASFDIDPETFATEIAPARTFALRREVDHLRGQGLIKGGTLSNALVVDETEILNDEPLRFPDEFVRHKILDVIGDLTLVGAPIEGHVIAVRSGHNYNLPFARLLAQDLRNKERSAVGPSGDIWDINTIMDIMPHRYPFLLVDRILELEDGKRVVGLKNVTINEPFFIGHFPGHPIMPAVLIIEAMAQVGGILLLSSVDNPEDFLVYFMTIDKAKFRKPVIPGDQLRFELEMRSLKKRFCKMRGKAYVDGSVVAEADLSSTIVKR